MLNKLQLLDILLLSHIQAPSFKSVCYQSLTVPPMRPVKLIKVRINQKVEQLFNVISKVVSAEPK